MSDPVNHPSHYETNGIECFDAIVASQGIIAAEDFCMCNALKYIWRHDKKNGVEDIRKAIWYLNKYVELDNKGETYLKEKQVDSGNLSIYDIVNLLSDQFHISKESRQEIIDVLLADDATRPRC